MLIIFLAVFKFHFMDYDMIIYMTFDSDICQSISILYKMKKIELFVVIMAYVSSLKQKISTTRFCGTSSISRTIKLNQISIKRNFIKIN